MDVISNHSNYNHIDAVKIVRRKIDHPLVLVCNGPSMKTVEYDRIPEDPLFFRLNWFFLEEDYYFGKRVDAYFWSVYNEFLHDSLHEIIQKGFYHLHTFFCPMLLVDQNRKERLEIDNTHHNYYRPRFDHWKIISLEPELARLMMNRLRPTTGLQALITSLILGFREIHIIGMDFYQSPGDRYAYNIPFDLRNKMSSIHFSPGYEKRAHSFHTDLNAWNMIIKCFPNSKIYSLSPQSYLARLTKVSPKRNKENRLFVKKEFEYRSHIGKRQNTSFLRRINYFLKNLSKIQLFSSRIIKRKKI
jgi:alpha-2,3 sialyltransferase